MTAPPSSERPRVSVIVPTLNAARTLERCLKSLREQTVGSEIIVVDYHSADATREIARPLADAVLCDIGHLDAPPPYFSAQRNHGADKASGDVLAFIDADMVLPPTVLEECLAVLDSGCGAVVVPEETVGEGFWTSVRALERSFYAGTSVESARIVLRAAFDSAGGFDIHMPAAEDRDLHLRLERVTTIGRSASPIHHDEGRSRYGALCRKKAHYAIGVQAFVAKHGVAAVRDAADRPYLRRPWKLAFPHPVVGMGVIALKFGELVAVSSRIALHALQTDRQRRKLPARAGTPVKKHRTPRFLHTIAQMGALAWRALREMPLSLGWLILASVALPSRLPPRQGLSGEFASRQVVLRFRSGHRIRCELRDIFSVVEVILQRCYDQPELPSGAVGQVVDIGANIGASAIWFSQRFPDAMILAVEPASRAIEALKVNITENLLDDRVDLWKVAVGGSRQVGHVVAGRSLANSHVETRSEPSNDEAAERVEVIKFSDLLTRLGGKHVDILKVDCEGGEFGLLLNASPDELGNVSVIIGEYHCHAGDVAEIARYLERCGFSFRSESVGDEAGMFAASRR